MKPVLDERPTVTVCSKEGRKQMATVNYPNQETPHTGHGHDDGAVSDMKSTSIKGKGSH